MEDKNKIKEAFGKLSTAVAALFEVEAPATIETKFAEYVTESGVAITVDGDLTIGATVTTLDAGGNAIPAPDGDHIVTDADGNQLVITVASGAITAVEPLEMEMSEMTDAEKLAKEEAANKANQMSSDVETLKADLAKANELIAELKASTEKFMSVQKEMFSVIEEMANVPAENSLAPKKNQFSKVETKETKLNDLANKFKNLNKK